MNINLSKLCKKRYRYTGKVTEIKEKTILVALQTYVNMVKLTDTIEMTRTICVKEIGLEVGDTIRFTATLTKRVLGYQGANIYCQYRNPKKEVYILTNPAYIVKERGHVCS